MTARRDDLVRDLVGDDHAELYRTSPTFKGCIDTLAAMLPYMIDGLAAQAGIEDTDRQALLEQLTRDMRFAPPASFTVTDGKVDIVPGTAVPDRPAAPLGDAVFRQDDDGT